MPLPIALMGWSAFIASTIGTMAFRLFAALGIGVATYSGSQVIISNAETFIKAKFADINSTFPAVFDLIVYVGIDQAFAIIFSAVVAVMAITPLKWVKK